MATERSFGSDQRPAPPPAFSDADWERTQAQFEATGAPAPFVQWAPDPRMAEHAIVHRFSHLCDTLSENEAALPADTLDLSRFGNMKDWLLLLAPTSDGCAFSYEHYGRGIARVYGQDMTGRTTADFPGHISEFFTLVYRAVLARKQRVMTVHQPPNLVFVSHWRRLIVPIADASGKVVKILTLTLPENELRAGLEILPVPVLIVSADRIVCYANKQARQAFDDGAFGPWNRTVFDYAALDLTIRETPSEILERGIVQTSLCRHIKHTQMGAYEATISAALHHDVSFYVILLQPRSH